ncbi:MAG: hypothetical protein K0R54_1640 [Clostridiaceae bacterium]|jgi:hypothetical protein|nr:hypothetical protein [Clostridiaceae bacterium]
MSIKTVFLTDYSGQVIFHGRITSLPLKEEKVIKKSIEMFNDSDPCIIHKSYVMKKIILDIDDYLNTVLEQGKVKLDWEYVPESIKQVLDFKEQVNELSIITA